MLQCAIQVSVCLNNVQYQPIKLNCIPNCDKPPPLLQTSRSLFMALYKCAFYILLYCNLLFYLKAWVGSFLICLAKEMQFMPVVPAILTNNKRHCSRFRIDSETVCLWLVDHSFDRAIKTLCYL